MSKIEQLMDAVRKHPQGIRTAQLSEATGITDNIAALMADAVKRGDVYVCKVSQPGKPPTNEYRIGGGVPVPELVPLKLKHVSVAHRNPAGPPLAKPAEPNEPAASVAVEKAPAAPKAPANDLRIGINAERVLVIALDEESIELNGEQVVKLGKFLHATRQVWQP